jgi:hypothetical protein
MHAVPCQTFEGLEQVLNRVEMGLLGSGERLLVPGVHGACDHCVCHQRQRLLHHLAPVYLRSRHYCHWLLGLLDLLLLGSGFGRLFLLFAGILPNRIIGESVLIHFNDVLLFLHFF